jgi:hypothetical protein
MADVGRNYTVVSILDSHRRDPGSIPCNVTFCPNLEIVIHTWAHIHGRMVLIRRGGVHYASDFMGVIVTGSAALG